jgi:polyisoprenyl-teichoic acid--peptidoglycan teichoic acid transferase
VENMLGVRVDRTAVIDQPLVAALVDRMGGIEVAVRQTLYEPDNQGRLVPIFVEGRQKLDGRKVVRYLAYQGPQETELSRLARQQQVWDAIFDRHAGGKSVELSRLVATLGQRLDGDGTAAELGGFLASFAALEPGSRTYDVLPVSAAGSGDDQAFRLDEESATEQAKRFMSPFLSWKGAERPRLQLLNGNGVPESGIAIALKLVPVGFHLVDTGNTRSFDHERTRIVVYADDAASLQLAEQVRKLLGKGEVEVAKRPQTGIDITVVVGKDIVAS